MTFEDLNLHIENYVKNDKTQRAIMLTGPWGSGKSYYIKNSLCPFFESKKINCIIISLYGVSSLKDISKSIYFEIRAKKFKIKSERGHVIKIASKTIAKGIASYFNIDLNQNDKDLQKLYESIDLSNRLVILEDLERTSLDIVEVMGFVNNLVEQDGAKILLVANEAEIIGTNDGLDHTQMEEKLKSKGKLSSDQTNDSNVSVNKYIKIKEKTVGDTILFTADCESTIRSVIEEFNSDLLNKLLENKTSLNAMSITQKIQEEFIAEKIKNINYRSLKCACQKFIEVVEKMKINELYNSVEFNKLKFEENMFISTVIYYQKNDCGTTELWNSNSLLSFDLGSYTYPLYMPMYNYIKYHTFSKEQFKEMLEEFKKGKELSDTDEQLEIIYSYYIAKESDLKHALEAFLKKLNENKGLVYNEYVRIANYLISIKYTIGFEHIIDECLKKMLETFKNAMENGKKIAVYFSSGIQLLNKDEIEEFQKFINQINEYSKNSQNQLIEFTYEIGCCSKFYDYIVKNKKDFIVERGFANKLDVQKTANLLKCSSASEIYKFRLIIQYIYQSYSNIKDYFMEDLEAITNLLNAIKFIDKTYIDRIQNFQLNCLIEQLQNVISVLCQ